MSLFSPRVCCPLVDWSLERLEIERLALLRWSKTRLRDRLRGLPIYLAQIISLLPKMGAMLIWKAQASSPIGRLRRLEGEIFDRSR